MSRIEHARRGAAIRNVALWSVLVVLLCTAVAQITLPFPTPESIALGTPRESERSEVVRRRAVAVRRELDRAGLRYRALNTLAQWQMRSSAESIVIDPSIPAADRARVEQAAARAWSEAAGVRNGSAALFITLDSTSLTLSSTRPLRGAEVRYFALPSEATGNRCIALVRLRSIDESSLGGIRLGPCAFYALYGKPGPFMQEWLESTAAYAASRTDLEATQQFQTRSLAVSALGARAGACVIRGGEACLDAVGFSKHGAKPMARTDAVPGLIGSGAASRNPSLGERQAWFLAEMARDLGRERFEVFWRSAESPDVAFRRAAGRDLSEWTRQWLQRGVAPITREAALGLPNVAWAATLIGALLVASFRRRDRVILRAGAR